MAPSPKEYLDIELAPALATDYCIFFAKDLLKPPTAVWDLDFVKLHYAESKLLPSLPEEILDYFCLMMATELDEVYLNGAFLYLTLICVAFGSF